MAGGRGPRGPKALAEYRRKRDFTRTAEPSGDGPAGSAPALRFVVQKHAASHLHFDVRLELDGVMKSWAVPKGPSLDPAVKRLAMQVEDHPIGYNTFEGTIPAGQYGGGTVMLWDRGVYDAADGGGEDAVRRGYAAGRLDVVLAGERLRGGFTFVRTKGRGDKPQWLMMKRRDELAAPGSDIVAETPTSVATGRTMEAIAGGQARKSAAKSAAKSATKRDDPLVGRLAEIEGDRGSGTLTLGRGRRLELSNLGKVFFPDDGYTKGDVLRHYAALARYVLPPTADRPLVLRRYPNGIEGKAFYQHAVPDAPAGVRTEAVQLESEAEPTEHLIGGELATILYSIQLGAVSVDPWHSRVGLTSFADYAIIDLDPGPKAPFARVVEVARWVKEALDASGLVAALKTSGATGLHVYLPLPPRTNATAALLLAQIVATRVAEAHPRAATIERSVKARKADSVYVDYLQNIPGKTVAAAYAVRARRGAPVSTPLRWEELDDRLDPREHTIRTLPARLAAVGDLWATAMRTRNSARALRDLARGSAAG